MSFYLKQISYKLYLFSLKNYLSNINTVINLKKAKN